MVSFFLKKIFHEDSLININEKRNLLAFSRKKCIFTSRAALWCASMHCVLKMWCRFSTDFPLTLRFRSKKWILCSAMHLSFASDQKTKPFCSVITEYVVLAATENCILQKGGILFCPFYAKTLPPHKPQPKFLKIALELMCIWIYK